MPSGVSFVWVSDNGHGLPEMRAREFPEAHVITDFYHTAARLAECAKVITGTRPACERQRKKLWHSLRGKLWHGQVDKLITVLTEEAVRRAPRPAHLTDLAEQPDAQTLWTHVCYLEKYQESMDYPLYRARGWPLGSGTAESGCGQFGNRSGHSTPCMRHQRGSPSTSGTATTCPTCQG